MLLTGLARRPQAVLTRLSQLAAQMSTTNVNGNSSSTGVSLKELPKSNVFTQNLPADEEFPTPADSHKAPRESLGPRLVKNALYTYVRPYDVHEEQPELLSVSEAAMRDIGIKMGEEQTDDFKDMVAGTKIVTWDAEKSEGIYPWAQCYGGWQFGNWASQLGDGRAISLFESTNPETKRRYEIQLKGAGKTPYSRFADGKAVLRSSLREYVVSEALNALGIPSTRALSLTFLPEAKVQRERTEPGAIVARFAQTWVRLGTFDLLRSRGNRKLIRQLADYVAENVYTGWESLPARVPLDEVKDSSPEAVNVTSGVPKDEIQGEGNMQENRYVRLYREVVRRNAKLVAWWQAYAFTNGVLNTDNTSVFGLSIDFGPFAFLDNFDPMYTPNHDDYALRYSYRNQPSIIWWNLVRFGEDLGELIGSGDQVDDETFVEKGVSEDFAQVLIKRAETLLDRSGEEYRAVFLAEYKRLMTKRLGLKTFKEEDFDDLLSAWLDTMEALELDFNQSFRKLCDLKMKDIESEEQRKDVAGRFFHQEGVTGVAETEETGRQKLSDWMGKWRARVVEDWGEDKDAEREKAMKAVNPKFIPKSWVLNEAIDRVQNKGDRDLLPRIMKMALNPFNDEWGGDREEEERFCGDVPKFERLTQCSCSS